MYMQLLVFITKQSEIIDPILSDMLENHISGATVIDGKGMLKSLNEADIDPPPIFGSLRQFVNPGAETSTLLMIVLNQEKVTQVRNIIHLHAGSLNKPNTGILFEIPVANVEGILDK